MVGLTTGLSSPRSLSRSCGSISMAYTGTGSLFLTRILIDLSVAECPKHPAHHTLKRNLKKTESTIIIVKDAHDRVNTNTQFAYKFLGYVMCFTVNFYSKYWTKRYQQAPTRVSLPIWIRPASCVLLPVYVRMSQWCVQEELVEWRGGPNFQNLHVITCFYCIHYPIALGIVYNVDSGFEIDCLENRSSIIVFIALGVWTNLLLSLS